MNDSRHSSNSRVRRGQRGVSLIEVLVVLVILVTGILTIIRLFPSGFFSIQSTGNAALGDSLGLAAIQAGAQGAQSLPDGILPGNPSTDPTVNTIASALGSAAAAYSNYDTDDPNNFENARVVTNETITVPTASGGNSVYTVKYGPVVMPNDPADPNTTVTQLPNYFTVNSPNWTALSGNSAPEQIAGSLVPTDLPQKTLVPGQERFLVDPANKKIAVPYASYTDQTATFPRGTDTVHEAISYPQQMVLAITVYDSSANAYSTYTKFLNLPAATKRESANPFAPFGPDNLTYLPDANSGGSGYQGGWFDPTQDYQDTSSGTSGTNPPTTSTITWVSATLYRPYNGIRTGDSFSSDPYQFKLLAANVNKANPGSLGFNPKAAGGAGAQARKARISYVTSSWQILHEDHDIPSLSGNQTEVVRTTVPNLLRAGSANPDNSINPGIAGSNSSLIILDLDTGLIVPPGGDPTLINDEDLNGTVTDAMDPTHKTINVSYSTGRITFGSNAFGDSKAHRVRIFYTADLNWTVAVQKAPAYFSQVQTNTATGTTALASNQFAYDAVGAYVYFARCNAGKTVEIDGSYVDPNGKTGSFSDTISVDPVLNTLGDSDVRVNLADGNKFAHTVPANSTVTFAAVRGLSARAVVAWKERNLWKSHSVDAVLNRTP